MPLDERAVHAGRNSRKTIGIKGRVHRRIGQAGTAIRAACPVAVLIFDLRLGLNGLQTHQFRTGEACPAPAVLGGVPASLGVPVDDLRQTPPADENRATDPDAPAMDHDRLGLALSAEAKA